MRKILRATRNKLKFTQSDVAKELSMTERQYRHIEAGTRGTSESNWLKLYSLLKSETPLHELMRVERKGGKSEHENRHME